MLVTAVGCQQILGLDDFKKQDASCEGAACDDGGGIDVVVVYDVATVDVTLPDVVDKASSWANGPMPASYAEVDAGVPDSSLANFIPVDGGMDAAVFFDNVGKKLYWSLATGTASDPQGAASYCAALGAGWRVPTRIELVTLLDSTTSSAPYASPVFQGKVGSQMFWTASYVRPVESTGLKYWFVNFSSGDVVPQLPTSGGVICAWGGT